MNKDFLILFGPEDSSSSSQNTDATSGMTDEDILNADLSDLGLEDKTDEENEEVDEGEDKEESTEESDETSKEDDEGEESDSEEDEGDEDQEEDREDKEELEPQEKATFQGIKAKYPNFFKEFPEMTKVFGTVRQYESVFSSPEEAKEVVARNEAFEPIVEELSIGSPMGLLRELSTNTEATIEFARNILPALHRVHQDLFHEATAPVLSVMLQNAIKAGQSGNDKYHQNLTVAAQLVSHWLFGKALPPDLARKGNNNRVDPEKSKLLAERREYLTNRQYEAGEHISDALTNELSRSVSVQIKSIPTLKNQPKYLLDKLKADIINAVDREITSDRAFISGQNQLWRKLHKTQYSDQSLVSRIKNAYLERGKNVVGRVTKRVLSETKLVKGNIPKAKRDLSASSGDGNRGRRIKAGKINPRQVDYSRTSDMDILNDKVTLKGSK